MKPWKWRLVVSVFAVLVLGNVVVRCGDSGGVPLQRASDVSGLPDDQLEAAVLRELGRSVYGPDADPAAWRHLSRAGRQLWAVAQAPGDIREFGLAGWLAIHAQAASSPGPRDLAEGLAGMGLGPAAEVAAAILAQSESAASVGSDAAGSLPQLQQRLQAALDQPQVRAERQAWVRDHLEELIGK
jgi:hypothetical protein